MDNWFDRFMQTVLVAMALFLFVVMPIMVYKSAVHTAIVWNRCHPSATVTTAEAFFTKLDITVCETGALKAD